jgi:transcriptional regulator with XRE-family HTH domain
MKNLESKIKGQLTEKGMTIQRLASESGISEPTIHAIFNRGDAKVSQLEKIAAALGIPLSFLFLDGPQLAAVQAGDPSQATSATNQKAKAEKPQPPASQQDLAAALAACQRELALTNALVAAKEETISLLRASYTRPS